MKNILKITLPLIALLILASAPLTMAGDVVGRITAGSNAVFVDTPHSVMTEGFTDFAAAIRLYDDGTAVGEFLCAIPDVVVLASQSATWSQNDDGSITVIGTMYGYFPESDTPFEGCSTTVTFRAGGPGVGGFDASFCDYPEGMYDTEVLRTGQIRILSK